ncbi:sensor histidine kinase [Actinoplanes sp. RD1]|uniref:sensor histidine kinase n=1 Tax=Actinoplanes sp. RD1 TaxID=3064538 RepID=UPI00274280A5|nr:sensor histidine kinase [Actinoplanes sp. RD1]
MSKRPETANAVMSRLRRPAGRLRDLPIWSKLGLIMLVPTLATIIVGTNGLIDHIDEADNAENARTLSVLSQAAGGLVDHLQNERAFGVEIATTPKSSADRESAGTSYGREHAKVDEAKKNYSQQKSTLKDLPEQAQTLLTRLDRNLEELPSIRSQAANGDLGADDVETAYRPLIDDLLTVRDVAAQQANDTELSGRLRVVAAVARAKDYISQQRDVGHMTLGAGDFNATMRKKYLVTVAGYDISDSTMRQVATTDDLNLIDKVISGPAERAATNLTQPLDGLSGDNTKKIPFNRDQWETAMIGYNDLFRSVENRLDGQIVDQATALRNDVQRQVIIESSLLLGMLLLAIAFAWLVARSMARSLRELRQGALNVAQFGLPQAVERLRDPALSGSLTPAQVADQVAEPLPVRSRDEFGQVTEAFNAVHLEAVRTAAEQAALRASVATMFVNLARRSQILVDRLIGHLDRLERGEEDPDRLAELFQLDHLATRMRRNDENLLVLAGADSTRVQREPAALIDVLRAAQSEVEHYTRIEFGTIDRDIEVAAHAVNDMVHLVAELFDNATAFSPPNSHVIVEARRLGDGAVLSVEDRGIGISREQLRDLNERLANPPMVDVAVSRMMGLVVVARLANRHGVRVELRPADSERGTVADVGLPVSVLVVSSAAGRLPSGESGFVPDDQPRPAFAEPPLALESGRGGFGGGRPFEPNAPVSNGGMVGAGAGRSVPAWSDLTGAPTGSFDAPTGFGGGSNGFGGGTGTNGSNGFAGVNGGSNGFGGANGFGGGSNGSQGANGFGGSNGSQGANGFHGPRSNEPIPPLPQTGPQGFDNLPQRRNGENMRPDETVSFGHTIPRQLPPSPETQGRPPFVPPVSAPPVPPISAPPAPAAFAGPSSAPPVPGQPISAPPVRPQSAQPASGQPAYGQPVSPAQPQSAPPVPASPPAWPPVSAERDQNAPHVPESLAAALDMTAELPRYRPNGTGPQPQVAPPGVPQNGTPVAPVSAPQQASAAAQIAAAQAAARQRAAGDVETQFADETMELPIFRELESAWFMTAKPAKPKTSPETEPQAGPSDESVLSARRIPTGEPVRTPPPVSPAPRPEPAPAPVVQAPPAPVVQAPVAPAAPVVQEQVLPVRDPEPVGAVASSGGHHGAAGAGTDSNPWRTAADDGWSAARKAAEMPVDTTTTAGLPRRTPMAQLVPGGVDRAETSVQRRTPEAVRGLLSAYHRGVQRGRTKEQSTNPEVAPGGMQSSQAGKEHEA